MKWFSFSVTWAFIAAAFFLNGMSWVFAFQTSRKQRELRQMLEVNRRQLDGMGDAYRRGLEKAANVIATLAVNPYNEAPAFNALMHAEALIRDIIREAREKVVPQ